jgi:hypothetical protein
MIERKKSRIPTGEETSSISPSKPTNSIESLDEIYKNFKLKQIKPSSENLQAEPALSPEEEKFLLLYRKNNDGTLCKVVRRREFRALTIEELKKIHLESSAPHDRTIKLFEKVKSSFNIPTAKLIKKPATQLRYSRNILDKYLNSVKKSSSPPKQNVRSAISTPLLNLYRQRYNTSPHSVDSDSGLYPKINHKTHWKTKSFKPQSLKDLNEFISSYHNFVNIRAPKSGVAMRSSERFGIRPFTRNEVLSDYGCYSNILPRIKNLEVLKGFT